jgi:hypothetical protein
MTPAGHVSAGIIGAILIDTAIFHRAPTAETISLGMVFSLMPDIDAPLWAVLQRKNNTSREKNGHHASMTHTPLFFLALTMLMVPLFSTRFVVFFAALSMIHLFMDSWATDDGIMWLWPHLDRQMALLPQPVREAEVYGWRYYRHFYFQYRRKAAYFEVFLFGLAAFMTASTMGLALIR